ncbi:hypothetical protein SAMN05421820_101489 [Pedobacter steynii]|uniref:Uncharacterized protein n=1 Tax=Pedobacter steynii TaxID=430522 RepID=A0A1G9K761_9SPHI|nr:hypothetical protein [Pedobacter steynii]NQX38468.1 hypothetical protein [Pedobacter steynii]SDL45509.1 hypothetical protein SAMN05421820_101489 [Pedobacter steynii]
MRTELTRLALIQLNKQTVVEFEDMTTDIDLFETAVAEYDEVILQLFFPNPAAGYPKFQLLKTDIMVEETTVYFENEAGESDLSFQEVVLLVNSYIAQANKLFKRRHNR